MVGLQWCNACDAPRFKWRVRDLADVPEACWYCGQEEVQVRLVADDLSELRRSLGDWARGDRRTRSDESWLNRRRTHVRDRFDQVIGWWERQPNAPAELRRLLREYHNRGRQQIEPPEREARSSEMAGAERLQSTRLHELTEQLKLLAEEERIKRESAKPKGASAPGVWRMFRRPPSDNAN